MGISWCVCGVSRLQGAFGHHHNSRKKIVHTEESSEERIGTRLSKSCVDRRRDCGTVTEIRWAFLGVVIWSATSSHVESFRSQNLKWTTKDLRGESIYMYPR